MRTELTDLLRLSGRQPGLCNKRSEFIGDFRPLQTHYRSRPVSRMFSEHGVIAINPGNLQDTDTDSDDDDDDDGSTGDNQSLFNNSELNNGQVVLLPLVASRFDFATGRLVKTPKRPTSAPAHSTRSSSRISRPSTAPMAKLLEEENNDDVMTEENPDETFDDEDRSPLSSASPNPSSAKTTNVDPVSELHESFNDVLEKLNDDIDLLYLMHRKQDEDRRTMIRGKYHVRMIEYQKRNEREEQLMQLRKAKQEAQRKQELEELSNKKKAKEEAKKKSAEKFPPVAQDNVKKLMRTIGDHSRHRYKMNKVEEFEAKSQKVREGHRHERERRRQKATLEYY